MHIMEGYLPPEWCAVWFIVAIPVVIYGLMQIKKAFAETDELEIVEDEFQEVIIEEAK